MMNIHSTCRGGVGGGGVTSAPIFKGGGEDFRATCNNTRASDTLTLTPDTHTHGNADTQTNKQTEEAGGTCAKSLLLLYTQ